MKIFLLMMVSFCCFFLLGEDKQVEIQGLFGYRLGDDVTNIKGKSVDLKTLEVVAKIPFRNFTKCEIFFTDEKKVYYIIGGFTYPSKLEAEKEFSTVLGMLEKKYNTKFSQENFVTSNGSTAQCYTFRENGKCLMLVLFDSGLLRLICIDTKINTVENQKRMRQYEQQRNNNVDAI